jgi:hypothetical protein
MAQNTILSISVMGIAEYSARGLTQTLEHIDGDAIEPRRTVNGTLLNLAPPQFYKFRSRISGDDQDSPPIDNVRKGTVVSVECICELSFVTSGGSASRPVVPGSDRIEGVHTFYRPRIEMMVTAFSVETNEWGAAVKWTLDLEEI